MSDIWMRIFERLEISLSDVGN